MALSEIQDQHLQEGNEMNDQSKEVQSRVEKRLKKHVEKVDAVFQRVMMKDFKNEILKMKLAN